MAEKDYVWFGMKVTPAEKQMIERLAERRGTSQKAVVLDAVKQEADEDLPEAQPGSFLEAARDLAGSTEGPPDLLRDPDHMEGYGRW